MTTPHTGIEKKVKFQDARVSILLVTQSPNSKAVMTSICASKGWGLHVCSTCREAAEVIQKMRTAVVICDSHLEDGTWRMVLEVVSRLRSSPRLLVSSYFADEHFWAEVLSHGGYDVVTEPLDAAELKAMITLAWHSWESEILETPRRPVQSTQGMASAATQSI